MLYRKCEGEFLYYDQNADTQVPCQVRITDEEIVVSYELDQHVVYKGKNDGSGHFELEAESVKGRASLHRFPNADLLVGYWQESQLRGMWRIRLAN